MLVDVYLLKVFAVLYLEIPWEVLLLVFGREFRINFFLYPYRTEECVIPLGGSFIEFDIHSRTSLTSPPTLSIQVDFNLNFLVLSIQLFHV